MSSTKSNNKVIPANIYFLQEVLSHPFVPQCSPVTNEYQTAALGDTVHHPVHTGFVVSWTQLCTYPAVVKFSLEHPIYCWNICQKLQRPAAAGKHHHSKPKNIYELLRKIYIFSPNSVRTCRGTITNKDTVPVVAHL